MCYAIPGKILSINGRFVTLGYFGEKRTAKVVFGSFSPGDYVYAQGGIVLDKVPEDIALETLAMWESQFFELKKVDSEIARSASSDGVLSSIISRAFDEKELTRNEMARILGTRDPSELAALYSEANRLRNKKHGNACCVHGILEFSNHCANDCLYCGIRCANKNIGRYRMGEQEILDAVDHAVEALGFKAIVLQSGEDPSYSDEMLVSIVSKIRRNHGILIFMSIGKRSIDCYRELYLAGAYGALLRFETSNRALYEKMRPGKKLEDRILLIKALQDIGFVTATGFLIGLPGQTDQDIISDIHMTKSLKPDMYSFGPFIPHPETPLSGSAKPLLEQALKVIALSRLNDPDSNILVTSALETLDAGARKAGLLSGANSLMINTTPERYRSLYNLYPGKSSSTSPAQTVNEVLMLLKSLGRAPTDIGVRS